MARVAYVETIASIAADGTMKAAGNIEVTVRKASDNSTVSIWNDRTASAPANQLTNPFLSPATGLVQFFVEAGEYKVSYHDTQAQVRLADFTVPFDAVPGSIAPDAIGFKVGDIKLGSDTTDHGRWLLCDGRELTQAEVEGALSLSAGQAASLMSFLGTGSSSKYGNAASSKVKLPSVAGRVPMIQGQASGMTNRPFKGSGSSGGAESVTLSQSQSALPSHGHGVTDPGHSHAMSSEGSHTHAINYQMASNTAQNGASDRVVEIRTPGLDASGNTTDGTGANGNHSHTNQSSSSGVSVNNNAGVDASQSHENMPPFGVIGNAFIRV